MDNNRRNSIVESAGSNGPDTRSQLNTLKPAQQRASEISQRQPRPEFYQQGPYGAPNRPPGQQQRAPPPQQQQQQQQPRTPGDKVSPWNLLRQALPPDVGVRGLVPPLQRPPPPSQYYNMQQRQPAPPQDQQQYRPQPQQPMQDRRPNVPRAEDRPPFRVENGRPVRHVGGGGDDDEEVVVNTSVNQQPQQQQPPLNRRDSTVFAGGRPGEGTEPNRQWQRLASMAQGAAAGAYGRPQDQYNRQSLVMPEGQEQRYPQAANSYNRPPQQQQQDDDGNRPRPGAPNGVQKPARDGGAPPLTRRDSVLDAKTATDAAYGGRRPLPPSDPQESDNGRRAPPPDPGAARRQLPQQDSLPEDARRPTEYRKTEPEDATAPGRRVPDYGKSGRPTAAEVTADNSTYAGKSHAPVRPDGHRDHEQQPRFERKASPEKEPKAVEHGNRASELRKAHYEAAHHARPAREQQHAPRAGHGGEDDGAAGRREPLQRAEDAAKPTDYYFARSAGEAGEPNDRSKRRPDNSDRDESQSKNSRPDTLKIIKDNEPLRDSSNSKGNYRGDNDVCKSPSKIPRKDRSELKTPTRAMTPKSPEGGMPIGQKKLPMNKVQVGSAPSPNLKVVRSKVGSLQNTSHKPGGGQVKIENRKLEWKAGTRIEAKNDTYVPGGGDKKIQSVKLQWNAKPKVGSLENKTHKPGGGDKKIETVKLDFKDKAKPKIGSKDNIKHTPGGGAVKIEDQKLEIKAQSKVGSLDNVKHKPGGGEVKIFDDKSYIKQTGQIGTPTKTQLRRSSSMKIPSSMKLYSPDERPKSQVKIVVTPTSEEDLYNKVGTEINKGGPRRSANSRSPSIQNNIVIPEEAVRTK